MRGAPIAGSGHGGSPSGPDRVTAAGRGPDSLRFWRGTSTFPVPFGNNSVHRSSRPHRPEPFCAAGPHRPVSMAAGPCRGRKTILRSVHDRNREAVRCLPVRASRAGCVHDRRDGRGGPARPARRRAGQGRRGRASGPPGAASGAGAAVGRLGAAGRGRRMPGALRDDVAGRGGRDTDSARHPLSNSMAAAASSSAPRKSQRTTPGMTGPNSSSSASSPCAARTGRPAARPGARSAAPCSSALLLTPGDGVAEDRLLDTGLGRGQGQPPGPPVRGAPARIVVARRRRDPAPSWSTRGSGYRLAVPAGSVDLARFREPRSRRAPAPGEPERRAVPAAAAPWRVARPGPRRRRGPDGSPRPGRPGAAERARTECASALADLGVPASAAPRTPRSRWSRTSPAGRTLRRAPAGAAHPAAGGLRAARRRAPPGRAGPPAARRRPRDLPVRRGARRPRRGPAAPATRAPPPPCPRPSPAAPAGDPRLHRPRRRRPRWSASRC